MKTIYLDLSMGAAGDMLNAALYELLGNNEEKEKYIKTMNSLGLEGVSVTPEKSVKQGITGTHMTVKIDGAEEGEQHEGPDHDREHHTHDHADEHHHDHADGHHHDHDHTDGHHHDHDHTDGHHHDHEHNHHHSSMGDIEGIVSALPVSDRVKEDVISVYKLIAEAESKAHDRPVSEIHFHEVGTKDAIADVTGVCLLMDMLSPDKVVASPIHVGSGHVHCAHGILPVPAPATAHILEGIPMYGGRIEGELCTPTGAALLKHFVSEFGDMPVMRVAATGYGMGKKDFEQVNCVRAMLGQTDEMSKAVAELSCNLDDMTPERIAFCMERLFDAGALDVYTMPIVMKKSRLGTMLCVMCEESKREEMVKLIFKHTTTIGIRESISHRYTMTRRIGKVDTRYGEMRVKHSEGYGVERSKYEYEDLARIAREISESIEKIEKNL